MVRKLLVVAGLTAFLPMAAYAGTDQTTTAVTPAQTTAATPVATQTSSQPAVTPTAATTQTSAQTAAVTPAPDADKSNEIICKRLEAETGSRIGGRRICMTAAEWKIADERARRETQEFQQSQDLSRTFDAPNMKGN